MLYTQAVQSGVSALEIVATGSNAQTRAMYNEEYAKRAQLFNIREARHTAELNIAAIQQDTITSNTQVRLQQDHAKAAILVNAAAAGVSGAAVDAVVYETEANEALALNANKRQSEQSIEQQLATIGSQTSALLAVESSGTEISVVGDMLTGLSSIDREDMKAMAEAWGK